MSDFLPVIKHLDISKASKDTTFNVKPLALSKSRAIQKVQDTLTLPAHFYQAGHFPINYPGRLLFQYNVMIGYSFSLKVVTESAQHCIGGSLFVKWREGNTVYRYRISLAGGGIPTTLQFGQPSFPLFTWCNITGAYNNEYIKSNCCFEFWVARLPGFIPYIGLLNSITFELSKLRNPVDADDIGVGIGTILGPIELAGLGVDLPVAIPFNQDNMAWLTN